MIATNKPFEDTRLFNDYHIIPGLYMPNGCMATSGSLLNWFVDLVNNDNKKLNHSGLDKLISKRSHLKTTCIILPYFLGEKTPIHNTNAKGTITGLTLNHNIEDLWIAFLESICFAFNHHLEVLKENKIKIDNIFASDGGSKSKVWMQIMSNVIQKNISVVEGHHGSSKGVAFLAAKSVDLYTSYEQSSLLNKQNKIIRFQKEYSNYYKKKYLIFKKLYTSLIDLYPKINELSQ
jgi:xylulokinase